jgi:16S rRNA (adenine1518-N6/adenine1519-N6)-dimethyltransferase
LAESLSTDDGSTAPPKPGELVRRHGLAADKRLGQHFLFDPSILRRIAGAAGELGGATVLEVGPGPGGLTRALLDAGAARVVAVERDPRFLALLQEIEAHAAGRLRLVAGDALTFDPCGIADQGPVRIIANLPYNIATALLFRWLDQLACIHSLVLMFQKEVAARLVAGPGSADYGRLAVMAQRLCRVERLFDLPPAAFVPPPRVHSSVVRLTPRPDQPSPELRTALAAVAQAAFGRRRKMLRASLKALVADPVPLLAAAGIAPTRRAEELSVEEFCRLAESWRRQRPLGERLPETL